MSGRGSRLVLNFFPNFKLFFRSSDELLFSLCQNKLSQLRLLYLFLFYKRRDLNPFAIAKSKERLDIIKHTGLFQCIGLFYFIIHLSLLNTPDSLLFTSLFDIFCTTQTRQQSAYPVRRVI